MAISIDNPFEAMRSWLFLPGADVDALIAAPTTGADVLVQELEDFTPAALRPKARELAPRVMTEWRRRGIVPAVRINPLETCGLDDLAGVMPGRPAVVMMSKVESPAQMEVLAEEIARWEAQLAIPAGSTQIVPNIESALGVVRAIAIAQASKRIPAMLVGTEDMVVDLGADRQRDGAELFYPRSRFLLECAAAGVLAIDSPYTFSDHEGAQADLQTSRAIGYKAKAVVNSDLVAMTNQALTPSAKQVAAALKQIAAFEAALLEGRSRADVDGLVVEYPSYNSAKRILKRHALLSAMVAARERAHATVA